MERAGREVEALVSSVAAVVSGRITEVTRDLVGVFAAELPQLREDDGLARLLPASTEQNCVTCLHVFQHGIEPADVGAPAAAVEAARRAAQHGIARTEVLRAYRLGQARFLHWCIHELLSQTRDAELVGAATLRMLELNFGYIDRVSEQVASAYELERDRWLQNRSAARAARVRVLLAEESVDLDATEATLGYRLRQHHLGVVAWVDDTQQGGDALAGLERAVAACADRIDAQGAPLVVPVDDKNVWAWLPVGGRAEIAAACLEMPADEPGVRLAVGLPASGVEGFRRTHSQALRAQEVATVAGSAAADATLFARVAAIASMCADIGGARAWVCETLGPLSNDDDRCARLRETLREFLATGGSYTAAADRLTLHKSTVQYRITKAKQMRGRPLEDGRLDVEVALLACRWFGPAVLRKPGG